MIYIYKLYIMKRFFTLSGIGIIIFIGVTSAQASVWNQKGGNINGSAADDRLGYSVSTNADGSVVAVGAPGNDGNETNSGSVTIYSYNGSVWQQSGNTIYGDSGDESGYSVSLSDNGKIVAIGAISNGGGGWQNGTVRIYQYDNNSSTWLQLGSNINGESGSDLSGNSVCLSSDGTVVAIGAADNDGNNGNYYNSGHVRIFKYLSNAWQQIGTDIDGDAPENYFGTSVSLSDDGTILAVGATKNDGYAIDAGQVKVFKYDGASWGQVGADIYGKAAYDYAGTSVSISSDGTTIAMGAPESGGGKIYLYKYNGTSWNQLGGDISSENNSDNFGESVSLSADGKTVAIGAPFNSETNPSAGHVRIFKYNENTSIWEQVANDIDGVATEDRSGSSVSLSNDGSIVLVGAPYNDGGGTNSGHARVFELSTTTTIKTITQVDISIYPNPTNGIINIKSIENSVKQISIINITGEIVLTIPDIQTDETVDLSDFENGIYIVRIQTDKGIIIKKIIKR